MLNEFDQIIREHFNLSDKYTRQYIVGLDEAGKDALLDTLANALYDQIVSNVDDIDFGTIPMSRGDITKVENFEKTEQCLILIRKLVLEYKQNPATVDIITTAIQNTKDLKAQYIKGYALDVEFPMLMYNLIVLCIVRAVSMIIATCVQFVSDPQTKTMKQALDKVAYSRTQDDVMFKQLTSYNALCKDGTMIKLIDGTIKGNKSLKESAEYNIQNTPEDNDPDAIQIQQVTSEDDQVAGSVESPFGDDNIGPDPEPVAPDTREVPAQEPVTGTDMPTDEPQTDELPVTEPDDTQEPAPIQVPIQQPDVEEAPDVAPNPDTDPNLDDEAPIVEDEPQQDNSPEPPAANTAEVPNSNAGEEVPAAADPNAPAPGVDPNAKEPLVEDETSDKMQANLDRMKEMQARAQAANDRAGSALDDINSKLLKREEDEEFEDDEVVIDPAEQEAPIDEPPYEESAVAGVISKAVDMYKDAKTSTPTKAAIIAGGTLVGIGALVFLKKAIINIIIPGLRSLVYTFMYTSFKISDYWRVQADFLEANADEIENSSDMDPEKREKVAKRQRKWAETFRKWSNLFNLDKKKSEQEADRKKKEDEKTAKKKVDKNDDGEDVLF